MPTLAPEDRSAVCRFILLQTAVMPALCCLFLWPALTTVYAMVPPPLQGRMARCFDITDLARGCATLVLQNLEEAAAMPNTVPLLHSLIRRHIVMTDAPYGAAGDPTHQLLIRWVT